MAKFFVSYSRSVKEEVRKVIALLEASGHEVWWDADIPVIADWWATILKHIEWCEVFIFVVSEKSVQSAYCLAELKYANERNRPILPFILEQVTPRPDDLPHRYQWLVYDGEPAHMLSAINRACEHIEREKHRDIRAPRPPEPLTDGKSLAQQYQEARRLANDMKFEEAKKLFRDIRDLDYGEWGNECIEWLERLNSYTQIMVLADDEATLHRARAAWVQHHRSYGSAFDPHGIEATLKGQKPPARRLRIPRMAVIGIIVLVVLFGAALMLLSRGGQPTVIIEPLGTSPAPVVNTSTQTYTRTPTRRPTASSTPFVIFVADSYVINAGSCTTLRWNTGNIASVYLDGQGTIGVSTQQVCPSTSTTYELLVNLRDGSQQTHTVVITVFEPPPMPTNTPTPTRISYLLTLDALPLTPYMVETFHQSLTRSATPTSNLLQSNLMRTLVARGNSPSEQAMAAIEEGSYVWAQTDERIGERIVAGVPGYYRWHPFIRDEYTNFAMGATIRWGSGTTPDACGFVFNIIDTDNYSLVMINRAGIVYFNQSVDDVFAPRIVGDGQAIRTGLNDTNRLEIIRTTEQLIVFVNGQRVLQHELHSEDFGRVALASNTPSVSEPTYCYFTSAWVGELR